jgi:hypothetical protein
MTDTCPHHLRPHTRDLIVSARATCAWLVLGSGLLSSFVATDASQPVVKEPGVSGYVLAPDGTPVSGGTVVAQVGMISPITSIDRAGRFRWVPRRAGSVQLLISAPGLAPYRVNVVVPDSRSLRLPVIRPAQGSDVRKRVNGRRSRQRIGSPRRTAWSRFARPARSRNVRDRAAGRRRAPPRTHPHRRPRRIRDDPVRSRDNEMQRLPFVDHRGEANEQPAEW